MATIKQSRKSIFHTILTLMYSKDNINIQNVRLSHLQYMLIFPLAPVFANMQEALFSDAVNILGLDAMTLMGSAYCLGAGALFAITDTKNMATISRILAVTTAVTFFIWIVMTESLLSLFMAIVFIFGLGGCAACASFAYTFTLNNPERLLGAVAISLFFSLNQLDSGLSFISGFFDKTYLTLLVIGTCVCLVLYKTNDFLAVEDRPKAKLNTPLKLTLYFFIAHYFVEIFYTYLPGASSQKAMIANGAVGILVVCLAIGLQFITKYSIWNMCNLFFIAMICTYGLYFMPEGSLLRSFARGIHGFEQIGYIAAYYLLGCVFKKHGDFRIFKLCLVTVLPISMVSYVIPGAISLYAPEQLPFIATLVSCAVFIVFILLSPAYSKHLFAASWADDFYGVDMTEKMQDVQLLDQFRAFNLTPREEEVAWLLLHGENTKQIATKLNISIHTVNFHIKNLYKKLGINNRAELFVRFN